MCFSVSFSVMVVTKGWILGIICWHLNLCLMLQSVFCINLSSTHLLLFLYNYSWLHSNNTQMNFAQFIKFFNIFSNKCLKLSI